MKVTITTTGTAAPVERYLHFASDPESDKVCCMIGLSENKNGAKDNRKEIECENRVAQTSYTIDEGFFTATIKIETYVDFEKVINCLVEVHDDNDIFISCDEETQDNWV